MPETVLFNDSNKSYSFFGVLGFKPIAAHFQLHFLNNYSALDFTSIDV